jgi:hypothetical protein
LTLCVGSGSSAYPVIVRSNQYSLAIVALRHDMVQNPGDMPALIRRYGSSMGESYLLISN